MKKETGYVIQFSEASDLVLTSYSTNPENCLWGNEANAVVFTTEQKAITIAQSIGGTRPTRPLNP